MYFTKTINPFQVSALLQDSWEFEWMETSHCTWLQMPTVKVLLCSSLQAPFVISGKKTCFHLQFIWPTLGIYFRIRWIMLWKHLCLHLLQEKPRWVGQVQYRNENRQRLLKEHPFYPANGNIGDMRLNCSLSVLSNIQQGTWKHCFYQRP